MKKRNLTKRIMATLIGIMMVLGLLPFAAMAADPASVTVDAFCESYYGTVTGSGSYEEGDTVTLTATPEEYMEFVYWLDATVQLGDEPTEEELRAAIVSYDAEYTFTATEDVSLEAVFFGEIEIPIVPLLITGTDDESLLAAEWIDEWGDFDVLTPGAEPISLPGDAIERIITIGDKQYEYKGFIVYDYDEATDTETAELVESWVMDQMPLCGSVEYWDWFTPISDGVYVAYMEYIPEVHDDDGGTQKPDDPETPTSPQTGDNSNIWMWFTLLLVGGVGIFGVTLTDRNRRMKNQ